MERTVNGRFSATPTRRVAFDLHIYTSLCSTEVSLQLCIERCIVTKTNLTFDLSNLNRFPNYDFRISPRDS